MIQNMRLDGEIFEKIKSGQKIIEIRLLDEKRKVLKKDDIINFGKRPTLFERLKVKVIDLKKYKSFEEVYDDFSLKDLGYTQDLNKEKFLEKMYKHYNKEEVKEYGVLAIKVVVI